MIPGRSSGEGNGKRLQYHCLENHMDRGIWWALVPWIKRVGQDLVTKPPPPMAESEEELKSLLMQVKEESEKLA